MGALATALIGVAVGRALRARPGWLTMVGLCGVAFACWAATRLGLAGPPVNKRMWTPGFVLLTAATSIVLLSSVLWSPMSPRVKPTQFSASAHGC